MYEQRLKPSQNGRQEFAGIRLAWEWQIKVRVVPTGNAIEESVDLAHEIYNRVFRRVPGRISRYGKL